LVFVGRIPVGLRMEVLALLLYWLGLAGWLLPPLAIDPDRWGPLPRWLPSSGIALSATMTVVIPAIAAARRRFSAGAGPEHGCGCIVADAHRAPLACSPSRARSSAG